MIIGLLIYLIMAIIVGTCCVVLFKRMVEVEDSFMATAVGIACGIVWILTLPLGIIASISWYVANRINMGRSK